MTLPTIPAPLDFTTAFERVVAHYGCTADEREIMRAAALTSWENSRRRTGAVDHSRICFAALVAEIDAGLAGPPAAPL